MSNSEYREAQQQARDHGLKARHEQRLESATYTAAEVKVLTAKARQEIAEEIAQALEAVPALVYPEDIFPPDGTSVDCQSAKVMRFAYPAAASLVREIAARGTE